MDTATKTWLTALIVMSALVLGAVASVYSGLGVSEASEAKTTPVKGLAHDGEAELNTAALAALVRAKVPMTLVDARTSKWDDGKRIPGAKLLTFEATVGEVRSLLLYKNALIVTYCGGLTCPLSHKLASRLTELGYPNVIEYRAGISGWLAAGHKAEAARAGLGDRRPRRPVWGGGGSGTK